MCFYFAASGRTARRRFAPRPTQRHPVPVGVGRAGYAQPAFSIEQVSSFAIVITRFPHSFSCTDLKFNDG